VAEKAGLTTDYARSTTKGEVMEIWGRKLLEGQKKRGNYPSISDSSERKAASRSAPKET